MKPSEIKKVEKIYRAHFGDDCIVDHPVDEEIPHIDIYTFKPAPKRNFWTYITIGMSDNPMAIPDGPFPSFAELIFYLPDAHPEASGLVRYLAGIPYRQQTWFSPGSTMNNGNPPQPWIEGTSLTHVLFMEPVLVKDQSMADELSGKNKRVGLLQVCLISQEECSAIWSEGIEPVAGKIFGTTFHDAIDLARGSRV